MSENDMSEECKHLFFGLACTKCGADKIDALQKDWDEDQVTMKTQQAKINKLKALLKKVLRLSEWCVFCQQGEFQGHKDDCKLTEALKG